MKHVTFWPDVAVLFLFTLHLPLGKSLTRIDSFEYWSGKVYSKISASAAIIIIITVMAEQSSTQMTEARPPPRLSQHESPGFKDCTTGALHQPS